MNYTIEKSGPVPAYLQLYKAVREDVVRGVYPFGAKLPSKRTVAEETDVSLVTVEHAFALLCDEGYLESRERSGYFVLFRADDGFAGGLPAPSASAPPVPVPSPSAPHAPTEFPCSILTKTMRRVMADYGEAILERSPNAGRPELREAIRQYLARSRGIRVETEQIVIGSGSEYLYGLIVELLGRGLTYAIESPSYQKIEQVYRAADVRCELLPLGRDGVESAALRASRADVLHISPYRSYPSGVTASASKRHEYLRWAQRGGRYVIEDDFESEFSVSTKPEETLFSAAADAEAADSDASDAAAGGGSRVIYMNSFSKTVSPALRVGYLVLPPQLVPTFAEKLGFYSCTVPTFEQFVLAELLSSGDFERHINRVRRKKRRELSEA